MRWIFMLAVLFSLSACTPLSIINAAVYEANYNATFDIAYGREDRQFLDVYAPTNVASAPVIIFVHGGSWRRGDKSDYKFLAETMVRQGAVAVIINYRLVPTVTFPAYVQDAAKAVAWVEANIVHYGGDKHRIFLMGHSAGAHIASLLAYDPIYLHRVGLERSVLRGFIGLAGPYDFLDFVQTNQEAGEAMGRQNEWERSQPILNIYPGGPPALLMHGLTDDVVNPRNAPRLAARLREVGTEVKEVAYPDIDHYQLIGVFSKIFQNLRPEIAVDVFKFVNR